MMTALGVSLVCARIVCCKLLRFSTVLPISIQSSQPLSFFSATFWPSKLPSRTPPPPAFERFLQLSPQNAYANYLAGLNLWRHARASRDRATLNRAQSLLARATELDPNFALAYFQRGVVFAETGDTQSAIAAFQHALASDSSLTEAHFRLAQLYRRMGDEPNSRRELSAYKKLTASEAASTERERHEIQQFVISSHDARISKEQP